MRDATPAERTVSLRAAAGDVGVVVAASAIANPLNVVYQFVASRLLGPDAYGTFAAALAIGATLLVLGTALNIVAMQETARMWIAGASQRAGAFVRRTLPAVAVVALAVGALVIGAGVALGTYVHVRDVRVWLWVGALVAAGLVASYARGAALGAHRFVAFGVSIGADAALRLGLGTAAMLLGFGVAGAVFGAAAGMFVGAIAAGAAIGALGSGAGSHDGRARAREHVRIGGEALRVAALSAGGAGLMFVDLIFAKHHFAGAVAGMYGAAGTLARIIPYGVGVLGPVVMPRAAAALHVSADARGRVAALTFGSSAVLAALALVVMVPLAGPLVRVLFGDAYADAARMLPLYACDGALLALLATGVNYLSAVGDFRVTPWLVGGVAAEAVAMAFLGTTPERLLWTAIAAGFVVLPIVGICVVRAARAPAEAPGQGGGESPLPA